MFGERKLLVSPLVKESVINKIFTCRLYLHKVEELIYEDEVIAVTLFLFKDVDRMHR